MIKPSTFMLGKKKGRKTSLECLVYSFSLVYLDSNLIQVSPMVQVNHSFLQDSWIHHYCWIHHLFNGFEDPPEVEHLFNHLCDKQWLLCDTTEQWFMLQDWFEDS